MRNAHRSPIHHRLIATALALSLGGLSACATGIPFMPSTASPAAAGAVHTELDRNGNAWVELTLQHLALPGTLSPARKIYVLWAESQFGRMVLLGQIKIAKDRSAGWEGTVPFEKFRLILSAEDIAWPERPREPYVVQTDYVEAAKGWF
jgi:hypothetical protein